MSGFPVWVIQHSYGGQTGPYDVFEEVEVRDSGVLVAKRHDGRKRFVAPDNWKAAGQKTERAVRRIYNEGLLSAEGGRWLTGAGDE